jgi:hypothetical protein
VPQTLLTRARLESRRCAASVLAGLFVAAAGCGARHTELQLVSSEVARVLPVSVPDQAARALPSLEPSPRSPAWCFSGGAALAGAPALAESGAVYVATHEGHLHALGPDGGFRHSYTFDGQITGAPAVWGDRVYVATTRNRVYALRHDASLVWVARVPFAARSGLVADADGMAHFVAEDGRLYGLTRWGTLRWSVGVPGDGVSLLDALAPGRLLALSASGQGFLLGPGKREPLGLVTSLAVGAAGRIAGIRDGRFALLGAPPLDHRATPIDGAAVIAAAPRGWVVVSGAGNLVWLGASGAPLASRESGVATPTALAVDGASRAYVADDARTLRAVGKNGEAVDLARPAGPVGSLSWDTKSSRLLLVVASKLCSYFAPD